MKSQQPFCIRRQCGVTPFAGVWIEIAKLMPPTRFMRVTPFAGVWIEIYWKPIRPPCAGVTPFAGVWIEIPERWED